MKEDDFISALRMAIQQAAREQAYIRKLHYCAREQGKEVFEPIMLYHGTIIGNYLVWEN